MAVEKHIMKQSFTAGADMSNATCQFCFVEISSSSQVTLCDGATDIPVGVLLNRPASGEAAEVLVVGMSKVRANADLAVGNFIGPTTTGEAVALTVGTSTTAYICGRVVLSENAGNADGYVSAFIDCLAPKRAI